MSTDYSFNSIIDNKSKILILGSLPGAASLRAANYYAHPQNKFWKIIYGAYKRTPDEDFPSRYKFILDHHLALWDVIRCANRQGSLDSAIREETPNNIPLLLDNYPSISLLLFNGSTAFAKYKKFFGEPSIRYIRLLSTSPACAGKDEIRINEWYSALMSL